MNGRWRVVNGRAADRQPAMMTTGKIELDRGAVPSAMEPEALSGSWLHVGALSMMHVPPVDSQELHIFAEYAHMCGQFRIRSDRPEPTW